MGKMERDLGGRNPFTELSSCEAKEVGLILCELWVFFCVHRQVSHVQVSWTPTQSMAQAVFPLLAKRSELRHSSLVNSEAQTADPAQEVFHRALGVFSWPFWLNT